MTSGIQTRIAGHDKMLEMGSGLLDRYRRLLRVAGVILLVILFISTRIEPGPRDVFYHAHSSLLWLMCWVLFVASFWVTTSGYGVSGRLERTLVTLQTVIALYFAWLQPMSSIPFLLILLAWQIALIYPPYVALAWIGSEWLIHLLLTTEMEPRRWIDWTTYITYFSFKTFTCVIVVLAKQEAEARAEQAIINGQLEATRELLSENTRSLERLRISRELHDAVGHRLTALFLHLEIALNGRNSDEMEQHVRSAQKVSKELLTDVRDVVRELRNSAGIDIHGALQALSADLPGLRVHLTAPAQLPIEDSNQAEVLIRCVQEIITNTMKHANATDLWIDLKIVGSQALLTARDNGKPHPGSQDTGFGLLGMQERFLEYGGLVDIASEEGAGFAIRALLPLKAGMAQA